ncbi:MAG: VWA domain-containing protein [Bacteroidetes bacterium]|nr:VWA domain-containing protein [Bacteroidota bacterium]
MKERLLSFVLRFVVACILVHAVSLPVSAQPDLNFKRIRLNWPLVEVYLSVGCDGIKNYFLQRSDIRISEDDRELDDIGIWCPDPTSRCPITVSLVFDASDSMVGEGNAGAKSGGYQFIGQMDNVIDEGCVIFFNHNVTVFQHMTKDTAKLRRAVSFLPAVGATAVWDGIYTGLMIAQTQGSNTCRAVVVLTDGEDNSSQHNLDEIIAYAVKNNIRVFPIGYGDKIREDQLTYLAQITGGEYYQTPDASALAGIYREISTIMYEFFQECVITYEPRCADGAEHTVELGIPDLCGGSAFSTRSYYAPLDSTSFTTKYFRLGEATAPGGAVVRIPLELATPFYRETLYPLTIDLVFDRQWLKLERVEVPPGTLLEGMNVHIADLDDGGRIRIPRTRVLDGTGTLCHVVFQSTTTSQGRSLDLQVDSVAVDKGCIMPEILDGHIDLTPSAPGVSCVMTAPDSLRWEAAGRHYAPDPIEVTLDLINNGTLIAQNGRVRLEIDTKLFEAVEPRGYEQSIGDIPQSGSRQVSWKLRAKSQGTLVDGSVCLRAQFSNHADVICCRQIRIPEAGTMLNCVLSAPPITWDAAAEAFVPNPFDLQVQVRNTGPVRSDTVTALIQLPQGLYLESGETYSKIIQPMVLAPDQTGEVEWRLRAVSSMGGDHLPVRILLMNAGGDVGSCLDTLALPWVPASFTLDLIPSGATAFCAGDSVILDAGPGYIAYRWSTGQTSRTITIRSAGVYFVTVMDQTGNIGRSEEIQIKVYPRPDIPIISRQHNTLITTGVPPLQWFRDGVPIPGANESELVITEPGRYEVETWTAEPCRSRSEPFIATTVSVHTPPLPALRGLEIYPDPSSGEVAFRAETEVRSEATLRILNMLGQPVFERRLSLHPGMNTFHYDLAALGRGVYIVQFNCGDELLVRRIIRQ